MDTSDPDIRFDAQGVCSHCTRLLRILAETAADRSGDRLKEIVDRTREAGRGCRYDSLIGLSGGVDSSYLAYKAVELGLRPLAVHLDNGWDSELAVQNIHTLVERLGLDLVTHVVDWEEFRELQLAFLRASVVDIEMLSDHAITAVTHRLARRHRIRYLLSGTNRATEGILPSAWTHPKTDVRHIRAINRRFGQAHIRTFPTMGTLRLLSEDAVGRVRRVELLNFLPYDKESAIRELVGNLGWRPYGGKHYESLFTRFYQGYILPTKFGIDKRRAHLSTLICSGAIDRVAALTELASPPYDPDQLVADRIFVLKKLGLSDDEFDRIMATPPVGHDEFPSDRAWIVPIVRLKRILRRT